VNVSPTTTSFLLHKFIGYWAARGGEGKGTTRTRVDMSLVFIQVHIPSLCRAIGAEFHVWFLEKSPSWLAVSMSIALSKWIDDVLPFHEVQYFSGLGLDQLS
jgi:hypothetical protein